MKRRSTWEGMRRVEVSRERRGSVKGKDGLEHGVREKDIESAKDLLWRICDEGRW